MSKILQCPALTAAEAQQCAALTCETCVHQKCLICSGIDLKFFKRSMV